MNEPQPPGIGFLYNPAASEWLLASVHIAVFEEPGLDSFIESWLPRERPESMQPQQMMLDG